MWSYEIDEDRHLVISTAWDVLTSEDIAEHRQRLKSDTRFNRNFFQLLDLSHISAVTVDKSAVQELVREHIFSSTSRRALLATGPLAYGLSHMLISLRLLSWESEQIRVFSGHDEAMQWLTS